MKRLPIIVFFAILWLIWGCNVNNNKQYIVQAERYIETRPDSAIKMLKKVKDTSYMSDNQKAFFILLSIQAKHKCHISIANDTLIDFATNYYTKIEDKHLAAKAFLYKGLVHQQRNESEKAAEAFALSEHWFEGVEDNQYKALLYNFYGLLIANQSNYHEALEHYKKSYKYYSLGDSTHYVLSACICIARMYRLLGIPDSAQIYYEKGLSLENSCKNSNRFQHFLLNYGTFLEKIKDSEKAELILKKCLKEIKDTALLEKVNSGLATLYYNRKEYEKALAHIYKTMKSKDSLMLRGGFLISYQIHKELGNKEEADSCYKWYNIYHNQINERLKTIEVSTIPHKITNHFEKKENIKIRSQRRWLIVTIIVLMGIAAILYKTIREKHKKEHRRLCEEMQVKDKLHQREEERMSEKINAIEQLHQKKQDDLSRELTLTKENVIKYREENNDLQEKLYAKAIELGKSRSNVTRKTQEIERLMAEAKESKEQEKEKKANEKKLKQKLDKLLQEQDTLNLRIKQMEAKEKQNRLIEHCMQNDGCATMMQLLKELRNGNKPKFKHKEFLPLLKKLACIEDKETVNGIERKVTNENKQLICYLIILGFDNIKTYQQILPLTQKVIKDYIKECEELIKSETFKNDA